VVQSKVIDIKEAKWARVKDYYESAYKIRIKKRPSDEKIEELYKKMLLLTSELNEHYFRKPGLQTKANNPPPIRTSGKDG